jgi:hypothetical protein
VGRKKDTMSKTMHKVKGKHVRQAERPSRLRDVAFGKPPTQEALVADAERLTAFLRGETRVMFDEEVPDA